MKKIIGILVALGLVLSMTVMATPVAADVTEPQVVVDNPCACEISAYNITFNITASLTEGVGCVCIEFPAGTTVPTTYQDGEIVINGETVFGTEVWVDGDVVCFMPPADVDDPGPVWVYFDEDAGIRNPCVAADDYTLFVWTCRAPDATPVESAEYAIDPALSEYGFVVDFGGTYPGIAVDFVPPFKACGQNGTDQAFNTTYNTTTLVWYDQFVLNFTAVDEGCAAPCDDVDIWFEVVACPEDETITLSLNGTWFILTDDDITEVVGEYDSADDFLLADDAALAVNTTISWDGLLHFDSVGIYELCFYVECPEVTCLPPEEYLIAERCLEVEVHQWKDAGNITIDEKWNLLSLPLVPFDSSIDNMLASLPAAAVDDLISIWHYDRCSNTWYVYDGNAYEDLTDIVDGKAYWWRMDYPIDGTYTWWVFGTEMPEPEASPAEYAVCEGWNMFGFTSLTSYLASDYLWNWATLWPVVYGWTQGEWTAQGWNLIDVDPAGDNLVSSQGYWGAFPADGAIYVPTP